MSEPRHIFTFGDGSYFVQIQRTHDDTDGLLRYSLTSGPEFEALMERARKYQGTTHWVKMNEAMRDLIAYFEEPRDE